MMIKIKRSQRIKCKKRIKKTKSEVEQNDKGKKPKEDTYPSKRTRSSEPVTQDCPF